MVDITRWSIAPEMITIKWPDGSWDELHNSAAKMAWEWMLQSPEIKALMAGTVETGGVQ